MKGEERKREKTEEKKDRQRYKQTETKSQRQNDRYRYKQTETEINKEITHILRQKKGG